MKSSPSIKTPTVETLYFSAINDENSSFSQLPVELLKNCLVDYATWGDLAKLACVQSSWSSLLLDAANQSHEARWELAQALLKGTHGLEINTRLAMSLLHDLAGVELQNNGTGEDGKISYTSSAVAGKSPFAPAMKCLAECHLMGDSSLGIQQDTTLGLSWLEAAFETAHDLGAAHGLGVIYECGKHSIETDVIAAADWFLKAAEGGHIEGMAEYALCCELGCGREQSDEEALEWYMKAARQGHVTANYSVGEAFEEARGVPQSDEEACLWYYKAAVHGDEESKTALRRLRDIARIVLPGVNSMLGSALRG